MKGISLRYLSSASLLSASLAAGLVFVAHARSAEVQRSGHIFYKSACATAMGLVAHCHAKIVTDAAGHPLVGTSSVAGYSPADLRDAYKITGAGTSSTIIAVVDAFGYYNAESDLAIYRSNFGLPACTTANGCFKKLNQHGGQGDYPQQQIIWALESALDLDTVSAICSSCKIYLIEANSGSFSDLGHAVKTAARLGAHVISNGYGGVESSETRRYEPAYNHIGVAVIASSGDHGYGVEFPASSPHVIAVGGTHLVRDSSNRGWNEVSWSHSGSGCSTVYRKPNWQEDNGCSRRTVADVSAVADPLTGVSVYGPASQTKSGWFVLGGTSAAAALVAGVYGVNGGAVNYGSNPYGDTADLFDVTSGSNGSCGGSYLCTAMPGYDGPTGLGTPNGSSAF